jgi:hypothetical protein
MYREWKKIEFPNDLDYSIAVLQQVARYTRADNYTAVKRMACSKFRWKAAIQSTD